MAQLQRIESALGHSMARSDEQLAYYVAQAREIIDLTWARRSRSSTTCSNWPRRPGGAGR
jgi:hypothetical protein